MRALMTPQILHPLARLNSKCMRTEFCQNVSNLWFEIWLSRKTTNSWLNFVSQTQDTCVLLLQFSRKWNAFLIYYFKRFDSHILVLFFFISNRRHRSRDGRTFLLLISLFDIKKCLINLHWVCWWRWLISDEKLMPIVYGKKFVWRVHLLSILSGEPIRRGKSYLSDIIVGNCTLKIDSL